MQTFIVTTPAHPGMKLRLLAYAPTCRYPSTDLKVVLQATDRMGRPIAEDPISTDWMPPSEFSAWVENQKTQGWVFKLEVSKYQRSKVREKKVA